MDWTVEQRGSALVGRPVGRVDEGTWEAFGARLTEAVGTAAADGRKLIVDFSALDYMSSRGLRAITLARRAADDQGVTIVLAAPNDIMREILAISRYDKIFTVADNVEAAL
ncbi:STAS domain-containing protein [Allosphingosinicella indica]|uniref:Anti-sigma factor antagonist n=1 Tax=Allosphingosinicella indica TaxID=941907 RepID=A0A1X7GI89_9SPHN|nr:STAS domain-containing protein [Allosphingosinicella indica]SMF70215.1 anti-sigma B factor antagonist/stage II sporulation protein AA (anti-sigma F factor antagonist) [Allosphingosinicella indica]